MIRWRRGIIVGCFLLAVGLCSCGKKAAQEVAIHSSDRVCIEGVSDDNTYEFCEEGVIYKQNNWFRYKEYASGESYVLCGDANCRHEDASCSAYDQGGTVYGVCYLDGYLYEFRVSEDAQSLLLVKYDLMSNTQETIQQFSVGSYEEGEQVFVGVEIAMYAGDWVWAKFQYSCLLTEETEDGDSTVQCWQYLGVNLDTGETVVLVDDDTTYDSVTYELVSDQYLVLSGRYFESPMLSELEFEAALEIGEFAEYADEADPYSSYERDFYSAATRYEDVLIYDIESHQFSLFSTDEMYKVQSESNGNEWTNFYPEYIFMAILDEKIYYSKGALVPDETQEVVLYQYAIDDANESVVFYCGNSILTNTYNYYSSALLDGSALIMVDELSEDESQLIYLDLSTMESAELFVDASTITFRPSGYTEDSYIGQMENGGSVGIYQISKEDFYEGNLSAATKLIIN